MIKPQKRKQIDNILLEKLQKETNLSREILEILIERDIDNAADIEAFFDTDLNRLTSPYAIDGMSKAVEFVNNAVRDKKKILIYGDYDCDGITSIALLKKYFDSVDYPVSYYLPDRELEGYGLSEACIGNFINLYSPEVVITVDCGVGNSYEIELLKKQGVEVLVTDHHEIPEKLPDCVVINPKIGENNLHNLAGVGVVCKLVEALSDRDFVKNFYDIAAIGTIADLASLKGDNRIIVKYGLQLINRNKILGLTMLCRSCKKINGITEGDIAFTIAPLLNSLGRMENANKAVELFFSTDTFFLNTLIAKLEKLNTERKFLCDDIYNQAIKELKSYDLVNYKVIVLYNNSWKNGVLGIVASRLVEQFNLPVILFGNGGDEIRGSARSVKGINMYDMLNDCRDLLLTFGGHENAAGLKINKNDIDRLRRSLSSYIVDNDLEKCLTPRLIYDLAIDDINGRLFNETEKLSPFGIGNPTPIFLMSKQNRFSVFASKHLKHEEENSEILAFNQCENINNFNNPNFLTVKLSKNTFNGYTKYQGIVQQCYSAGKAENSNMISDYIKSLLYPAQNTEIEYIDDYSDVLDKADNLFGTMLVAFSEKCFNNLCKIVLGLPKYKDKFFIADVKGRSGVTPYNRVVLSPQKNYDFSGYNNIVFVETPLNMVYHNNISNAKIVEDNTAFKQEIKELNIDRALFANTFTILKSALVKNIRPKNVDELYGILKYEYGLECNFIEFTVAFYVFYELEFISVSGSFGVAINKNIKKPLEQSRIYAEILKIKNN